MFTPFAFVKSAAVGPPPPPTNGMLLGIDISDPTCYPGTGTTVFNLANLLLSGTISNSTVAVPYIQFAETSNSNLIFTTDDYDLPGSAWSYVIKTEPRSDTSQYWAEKGPSNDSLSIVWGYDGETCRPWTGNYNGMNPVSTPKNIVSVIAFTKDTNGVNNNYKSYKDAVLQQQLDATFTPTGTTGFSFNMFDPGVWRLYNFYFYNRALTADEVTTIYNYVL